MEKINLYKLDEVIRKDETLSNILTSIEYDDNERYLALKCLSSISDDYETFAEVYEDGLLTMMYGGINVLDVMASVDEYYDPATGGVLPEFDNYENLLDIIISSIEQDIKDEKDYLYDVSCILGMED